MRQQVIRELEKAAGRGNLVRHSPVLAAYRADASGLGEMPAAVIRAREAAQVARVLEVCNRHRIAVVTRGGGSGLVGGAGGIRGGVVLDMASMHRILKIDQAHQLAVVEPGVITARLQEAAREKGLFYPPDPASVDFSTVGGNVATNAGGLRAVKYGVTREYVLGLVVVLADGRVMRCGGASPKSVVGYDLTRLMVGSEGTLGVIVELTLKLLPLPEAVATAVGSFSTVEQATEAIAMVRASGLRPVACEFMDRMSLKAVSSYAGIKLSSEAGAMVLVEVDGSAREVREQISQVAGILKRAGGWDVRTATDPASSRELWKARRLMGPALLNLAPAKIAEDVAVPLGKVGAMVRALERVSQERGVMIVCFGHAGDGNIHVNILYDPATQAHAMREAVGDVFAHALALGGTLSGEHGIGTLKLGYVGAEVDPVALEMMQRLKQAFDPNGILNPHRGVPSPGML